MASLFSYLAPDRLVADQLRRAPLFAALPTDRHDCLAVLREGAVFELPAGVEVVSPGDPAALIVVTEGGLADAGGSRTWPAGGHLGAAEILAGRSFDNAIVTVAQTLLYRLDGRLIDDFLKRCPVIARRLMLDLAQAA